MKQETKRRRQVWQCSISAGGYIYLSYKPESFDHIFVCFVLEHLPQPVEALQNAEKIFEGWRPQFTVIEGDHGSAIIYPASEKANKAISVWLNAQQKAGRQRYDRKRMYPLLPAGWFLTRFAVSPRMVYVDPLNPNSLMVHEKTSPLYRGGAWVGN